MKAIKWLASIKTIGYYIWKQKNLLWLFNKLADHGILRRR